MTGDFVPDYLRNCDVLSIAPHPHLLPPSSEEKAVEPNDDDANTRFGVDGNASNGNHGDGGAKNENSRNVPDEKEEGAADTADAPTYDDTEIRVTGWKLDEGPPIFSFSFVRACVSILKLITALYVYRSISAHFINIEANQHILCLLKHINTL